MSGITNHDPGAGSVLGFSLGSSLPFVHDSLENPRVGVVSSSPESLEDQLTQARLGVGSSLYRALRWKHEPTAHHCLRVALTCTAWAQRLAIDSQHCEALEFAALLHDIGKIGIPDAILTKPAELSTQEWALMRGHWLMGQEILRGACNHRQALSILSAAGQWYDGSRSENGLRGDSLPLGARMLSIVDAFDAITHTQVYRPSRTREQAFEELTRHAGRQFDPKLVKLFREAQLAIDTVPSAQIAGRWLRSLDPVVVDARWQSQSNDAPAPLGLAPLFQSRLLENMYDAVAFIDNRLRVIHWNRGAERLTGLTAATMYQAVWAPSLLGMRDEHGRTIADDECPVAFALRTGVHWLRRLSIAGRRSPEISVDAQLVPVLGDDGVTQGLSLLLHDVSPEITLEERCQDLQAQASRDPLTQVANRAEFDRVQLRWLTEYGPGKPPFCLIIADIDHFKKINDTFGHPAGDAVIQNFAEVLRGLCRPADLVSRYGGEEFAVLCHDCDKASAARRAEEMRAAFASMKHAPLGARRVTASFGVTEIQPGDSPETMLRRADRALYEAKDGGRDRVEVLGAGADATFEQARVRQLRRRRQGAFLIEQEYVTAAPLETTLEKLRGFIADHDAHVIEASSHAVALRVACRRPGAEIDANDRPLMFLMDLKVAAEPVESPESSLSLPKTHIQIRLRPEKDRERRRNEIAQHARQLLSSFRAYLMVESHPSPDKSRLWHQARNMVRTWFDR